MEGHITAVGALRIGYGSCGIILAIIIFFTTIGVGFIVAEEGGDDTALAVISAVMIPIVILLMLLSLADIIGGIGVLKRKNWARYLVMIHSVLDFFNIPFGTAIGIYSLWVLSHGETARLFAPQPRQ